MSSISARIYRLFNVDAPFDPTNRFQTAYLLSPLVLGCLRLLISFYIFLVLLYELIRYGVIHDGAAAASHWSYFTNITYWSIGFYMAFAGMHTVIYARRGVAPLQHWPRILQHLHSLFYTTIVIYPFLVTIVFWVILSDTSNPFQTTFTAWSNISAHAFNSVFALFELLIPRTEPPPLIHLLFTLIFLALYLAVAYITHATEGFYTYDFLDPKNGQGALCGYVFGIMAAIIVWFGIIWCVLWVKVWLFERKIGRKGWFSPGRTGDEEMSMGIVAKRGLGS